MNMKIICAVLALVILDVSAIHAGEILHIESSDGEELVGRLVFPSTGFTSKIVIDVPGTGPHTYTNRRKIGRSLVFNYHDYFADECAKRGIAYFSYSTRYTVPDTLPPFYDRVDRERFLSYTPSVKVKDLETIVTFLRDDPRLAASRFILLGQSAGAIIAAMTAERNIAPVEALFLVGTPADDVYTTVLWQFSGEASMVNFRKFFDANHDAIIQRDEYENGDPRAIRRVGRMKFKELDTNEDSVLTAEDFGLRLRPTLEAILAAIENGDDEWIWNNLFRIGTRWIEEHRDLEPNRTRILKLDLPVYIFHGEYDANCPVAGIREIERKARELGKDNIRVFIFPEHDHTLEFLAWVVRKSMPPGLRTLFDELEAL